MQVTPSYKNGMFINTDLSQELSTGVWSSLSPQTLGLNMRTLHSQKYTSTSYTKFACWLKCPLYLYSQRRIANCGLVI
jgi:hypothetical protein